LDGRGFLGRSTCLSAALKGRTLTHKTAHIDADADRAASAVFLSIAGQILETYAGTSS
jgi:hypothetical protein